MVVVAPAALVLAPGWAAAATINVNSIADNTDDDGLCTLREAVDAATDNAAVNGVDDCPAGEAALDTILLPAGTYPLSGTSDEDANASGDLDVEATGGGPLRVEGAGQGSTVIDAAMNDRAIEHRDADSLTLADLTVTNGKTSTGGTAAGRGGGIQTDGSGVQTLNLERVTVNGNESDYSGGGLFVGSGDDDEGGIRSTPGRPKPIRTAEPFSIRSFIENQIMTSR